MLRRAENGAGDGFLGQERLHEVGGQHRGVVKIKFLDVGKKQEDAAAQLISQKSHLVDKAVELFVGLVATQNGPRDVFGVHTTHHTGENSVAKQSFPFDRGTT